MKYEIHPAANEFPMLDAKRHAELVADIATNGQRETIKLYQGTVLDGRNRLKACQELGLTPKTATLPDDTDPWSYVWSLNGERRDLVADHRAQIWVHVNAQSVEWQEKQAAIKADADAARSEAAKAQPRSEDGMRLAEKPQVMEQTVPSPEPQHQSRLSMAAASGTNAGAIQRAITREKKDPVIAEKVRKGEMKPAEADRQIKKAELSQKAAALPIGQYRVIYADPPWHYGDGRTGDLMTATGAQDHYPTMKLAELKALDVPSIAAPDAVLFLWATSPLLPDALELAQAWGFKYKASFIWDKVKHNLGHYNSVRHEFLLICTKGSATPDNVKLYDSVQSIERQKHSAKPEEFRAIIDELYTVGARIELFRRGDAVDGWEVWGNESAA
jgi:N6-adenosine-specific RNA methylase IME4